jgi:hypothetical protein
MSEITSVGMVLATLVDPAGKPVKGGSTKGQLYVSQDEIVVLRPTARTEILQRAGTVLLLGSIAAVVVNLFTWKQPAVLWVAIAAQGVYWALMPARRRTLEPEPITADGLAAARNAGRVAIRVPVRAIVRAAAPEPPRSGFRKPARFELADGALEVYLSTAQYDEVSAALARASRAR